MRPKEAFGTFACIPAELHPDWVAKISLQARLIGIYIISKCKDPSDLRVPVGTDWKDSLCTTLAISGPDRRNAKASMQQLADRGFLSVEGSSVSVNLVPVRVHSCLVAGPLLSRGGSTKDPNQTQVVENTRIEIDRIDRLDRIDENACEELPLRRRPVPEPRGDDVPALVTRPAPWIRVWRLYEECIDVRPDSVGFPSEHRNYLEKIARSVIAESGFDAGEAFDESARKLIRTWLADEWVEAHKPSLAHLASPKQLDKYVRLARVSQLKKPLKAGELPPAVYQDFTNGCPIAEQIEPSPFLGRLQAAKLAAAGAQ